MFIKCCTVLIYWFVIDINECLINPCLNGGVCSDLVNGFVCTCAGEFSGTLCERGNTDKNKH